MTGESAPRPRRPLALTIAAWTAWSIGIHLPLVPGVILYLLIPLGLEVGFGNMLLSGPGLRLVLMTLLSSLSAWATLAAGWDYFRSRGRRGNRLVFLAVVSEAMAASLIFL